MGRTELGESLKIIDKKSTTNFIQSTEPIQFWIVWRAIRLLRPFFHNREAETSTFAPRASLQRSPALASSLPGSTADVMFPVLKRNWLDVLLKHVLPKLLWWHGSRNPAFGPEREKKTSLFLESTTISSCQIPQAIKITC